MMKFFRHIRHNLIGGNRITSYLLYASGEIILVVIGILIALQINNWNHTRIDKNIESNYLAALREGIKTDTMGISNYILRSYKKRRQGLIQGREYYQDSFQVNDTIDFVEKITGSNMEWAYIWTINTNVYNELQSTGNLRKIRDPELRQEISKYYSRLNLAQKISDDYDCNFRKFIQSNLFYDDEQSKVYTDFDYQFLMKKLKTEEFYELCNLQLVHLQTMYSWALNNSERATELLESIDNYTSH